MKFNETLLYTFATRLIERWIAMNWYSSMLSFIPLMAVIFIGSIVAIIIDAVFACLKLFMD